MTGSIIKYIDNCCKLSDLSYSLIIMPSKLCSLVSIIVLVMVIIANILLIFTFIIWCIVQSGSGWTSSGKRNNVTAKLGNFLLMKREPVWWTDHPSVASFLTFHNFSKLFSDDCKYFWGFEVHLITTFPSCNFSFVNLKTYINI